MLPDQFMCYTIDNMFTSASAAAAATATTTAEVGLHVIENDDDDDMSSSSTDDNLSSFVPGSTNGNNPHSFRYFKLFPYLNDDIKFHILSYVADAPFEVLPTNYPVSFLTHNIPQVNRKFHNFSNSNIYWKDAIIRMMKSKESKIWRNALYHYSIYKSLSNNCIPKKDYSTSKKSNIKLLEETYDILLQHHQQIQQKHHTSTTSNTLCTYKHIYKQIVNNELRHKGPVYIQQGHVILGEQYVITLNEPKYRLMMNELLKNQCIDECRNGHHITKLVTLIHANRLPLEKSQTAILVYITNCHWLLDGTVSISVLPYQHVWLEQLYEQPNTFGLIYGQCLKMTTFISNQMNYLTRQEALVQVMDNMTRTIASAATAVAAPVTTTSDVNHNDDNESFLSNQYQITDDEIDTDNSDSDSESDFDTSDDESFISTDSNFETTDDDDDEEY